MEHEFIRLELNLKTLATQMVGQVIEHNSHIAETVRDEVDRMVKDGALEATVRRETRKAVEAAIASVIGDWQSKQAIADYVRPAVLQALQADDQARRDLGLN